MGAMSYRSLTTALTLYRSRTLTLEQAARHGGVSTGKIAAAARSRGIPVREEEVEAIETNVAE